MEFLALRADAVHKFGMIPTGSCVGGSLATSWVKRRRPAKKLKQILGLIPRNRRKRLSTRIGQSIKMLRQPLLLSYDWSTCHCAHKRRAKNYWMGR